MRHLFLGLGLLWTLAAPPLSVAQAAKTSQHNYPVQYLLAPDEGHGFARPVNNMAMFAASEKFLASQLKGRYQESMTPAVAKRLQEITVDPKTVQLMTQTNVK